MRLLTSCLTPCKAILFGTLLGLLPVLFTQTARAELVVVVSAKNPLTTLSEDQVASIFLGRSGYFSGSNDAAMPVDLPDDSPARSEFYRQVTGKSASQLKAYWSKLIFTGQAQPPREVADAAALKKLLDTRPAAIGYIDKNEVDASLKIVLTLH